MTKTEGNLYAAFVGEAKATARLWGYALKAEQEGYEQIAKLFRAISAAERIHAVSHLRHMKVIGDTEDNLEKSFESEKSVSENYYPAFIQQADEDGHKGALISFSHARDAEEAHAGLYKKAMAHMAVEEDTTYQVCSVCGYVVDGEAPDTCPVCGAPQDRFFAVD
ncbi:MAG: rubrerythrin family protein [Deltaproteobacteria bacterium]|nr:rubrerythrin family protein [Deltaproteobacteria bacterium]